MPASSALQNSTSPLSTNIVMKKKKSPFAKFKKAFITTTTQPQRSYDESGPISPPITPHAPLTASSSPMSMTPLQPTPRISNADRQQRHLAELYAVQRASSPRLASRDEMSGRHVTCRPVVAVNSHASSSTNSLESYDDELSRQLRLASMEDRRGWEEKRGRMLELRGYENLKREDWMVSLCFCLLDVCGEVMEVGNWFGFFVVELRVWLVWD
jgi:transglutaminase/protease-like cytokinesis protein 3